MSLKYFLDSYKRKQRVSDAQFTKAMDDLVDRCAHERITNNGISLSFIELDDRISKRVVEIRRDQHRL